MNVSQHVGYRFPRVTLLQALPARAQQTPSPTPPPVMFETVRVFDGTSDRLSSPRNVLVVGNKIQTISDRTIAPPAGSTLTCIAGNGRTLMPA